VAKSCKFSLNELMFIGVSNYNRFPCNRNIFKLDLTKAKYSINKLRWKKEIQEWKLTLENVITCEKKINMMIKIKFESI
jgi:hypothetical protein